MNKQITFELPEHSKITKNMIYHLDSLLEYIDPKELNTNLINFYLDSIIVRNKHRQDLDAVGGIAEDLYFILQFLKGLEEEILKCEV